MSCNATCLFSVCGETFVVPTRISDPVVKCTLSANCSRVDCCMDYAYLNMKLHYFLHLDQCNYIIKGGIEKKNFTKNILGFQWGKDQLKSFILKK